MLQITAEDIFSLLPVDECIDVVEEAMRELSRGRTDQPDRRLMPLGEGNAMGIMPGAMREPAVHGVKILSLYPNNPARGLSSHQGVMLLFDTRQGTPLAALDAAALTAHRTAAATAAATRALSRTDACVLAILGAGEQAEHHLPALMRVRNFATLRLWSRNRANAEALAGRQSEAAVSIQVAASAREAVAGADVIVTVTASHTPILEGAWLEPGQHVNLVGASISSAREIDDEGVARGRFFVDCAAAATTQAGELLGAIGSGMVDRQHVVGEIGTVYDGGITGRRHRDEITIYKSLGTAAQDLAIAHAIWRRHPGRTPEGARC
jgi:ornithine cyclodeaminase/alanine dehydrogenase-like protein (mu-crystallin family)